MVKQLRSKLGVTFSTLQCAYFNFSEEQIKQTLKDLLSLNLDTIRLCSYWSYLEEKEGKIDFPSLDWQLDMVAKAAKPPQVVMCVGLKQPRWPEFHFPKWAEDKYQTRGSNQPIDEQPGLADQVLEFTQKVVNHTKDHPNITWYQVENEALKGELVANNRYLSLDFLKKEVELVRSSIKPNQKIFLTCAIDLWPILSRKDTRAFHHLLPLAEAIGINVYVKIPLKGNHYFGPTPIYWSKLNRWVKEIKEAGKEPWISEVQFEPWEDDNSPVHIKQREYQSMDPKKGSELVRKLDQVGFTKQLLWGGEHWEYHKLQGHTEWWDSVQQLTTPP